MPPITKNLLIINVLFFAAKYVARLYGIDLDDLLGLHFILASHFHFYQIFTYMFMHGSLEHLFFNMFAVWMFGRIIERTMGQKRFLYYYLTCGLGAGLIQEIAQIIEYLSIGGTIELALNGGGAALNGWNTVGASGAVYGILLAFGMTFPEERMFIFPLPVPIKAKYFVIGYAVIELMSALGRPGDGVAHFAHLGGMLFGLLLIINWRNGGKNRHNRWNRYNNGNYDRGGDGDSIWNNFRRWFFSLSSASKKPNIKVQQGGRFEEEIRHNQRKKEEEEELNRILDKVKRNGYAGLSEEEKKRLFDMSKRQ